MFVSDFIFLEGSCILFKTILALLTHHKDSLLVCEGFEQIMDYLKIKMPEISKPILDSIVKMVRKMYAIKFHHVVQYMITIKHRTNTYTPTCRQCSLNS